MIKLPLCLGLGAASLDWLLVVVAVLPAAGLAFNVMLDPLRIYWRRGQGAPASVLRRRKLELMQRLQAQTPIRTLVVGGSRIYNLDLGAAGFPAPVFNFAVTNARVEDYLAAYRLVCAGQASPPAVFVICCATTVFHPSNPLPLEAQVSGSYSKALAQIGAISRHWWTWLCLLIAVEQYRLSWQRMRRLLGLRAKRAHKFHMREDGWATWTADASPGRFDQQLRSYPFTGIRLTTFTEMGAQRSAWWEQVLAEANALGSRVVALVMPGEHPAMLERIVELGGGAILPMMTKHIRTGVERHGGLFLDWHAPAQIGLTPEDYRDALHLSDEAQTRLAARLHSEYIRRWDED